MEVGGNLSLRVRPIGPVGNDLLPLGFQKTDRLHPGRPNHHLEAAKNKRSVIRPAAVSSRRPRGPLLRDTERARQPASGGIRLRQHHLQATIDAMQRFLGQLSGVRVWQVGPTPDPIHAVTWRDDYDLEFFWVYRGYASRLARPSVSTAVSCGRFHRTHRT
jgi:hypothetical protein